jgi:hypothetical protein
MPRCPDCHTEQVIKNGSIHTDKPKYVCKDCDRQCVLDPAFCIISDSTNALIDRLLLEKFPWRALHDPSRSQKTGSRRMSTRNIGMSPVKCGYAPKKAIESNAINTGRLSDTKKSLCTISTKPH